MFEHLWDRRNRDEKDMEWDRQRPRIQPTAPGRPGTPVNLPNERGENDSETGKRGVATYDVSVNSAPRPVDDTVRPAAEISLADLPSLEDLHDDERGDGEDRREEK